MTKNKIISSDYKRKHLRNVLIRIFEYSQVPVDETSIFIVCLLYYGTLSGLLFRCHYYAYNFRFPIFIIHLIFTPQSVSYA